MNDIALHHPAVQMPLPWAAQMQPSITGQRLEDRQMLAMQQAFARHGGLASGDDVARRLRRHADQPLSMLARWIVGRDLVSVVWRSQTWLPLFQFELSDMTIRPAVTAALHELVGAFDDWDTAHWFASPNSWLCDATPVDMIASEPESVAAAARADRYVALG